MLSSLIDYQKLEKVEVGGLMGRWYSPVIEDVYQKYIKYAEKLVSISYDPIDFINESNNALFLEDYDSFLKITNDFDNCLATISKACFENSHNLMSLHKVKF